MTHTANTSITDMEQMRQQLELLKQKLDRQDIVNDRIMAYTMKHRMSWMYKLFWAELLVAIPFMAVYLVELKELLGYSWWSYALILLLMLVCVGGDFYVNRMNSHDWEQQNLKNTLYKLIRQKRARVIQVSANMVLLVGTFIFVGFDCHPSADIPREAIDGILAGTGIGGCIGMGIGLCVLYRMQHTNSLLIAEIKDMNL